LGIKAITLYNRFGNTTLFPNPVRGGSFTLSTVLPSNGRASYLLTDMNGRILQKGNITSEQQQVNVSNLAAGSYLIKLSSGDVIKWLRN
jgi:hypothetical protein